ncbi:response regulator [Nocardioides rotundus]|uniref:response regulator transcription factor n=1 Tax=Nocardioides rotundus TaxID=1774216 RepID=UPI001CC1132E|nr:response regulator [Nocardioides rotundus]UAL29219.1 response regulator [Nocardioides rotundus]
MARILVADDDQDIRELVCFKLEQAGHEVVSAPDGSSALARLGDGDIEIALLDIMMPGLSGLDVLTRVRADERLRDVKVILLTARSRDVDVDAGYATGADDYVIKPFSPRELVHRVSSLLQRA